jgi:hypothetical protein
LPAVDHNADAVAEKVDGYFEKFVQNDGEVFALRKETPVSGTIY